MKKRNILRILIMFIAVSLCLFLKSNVQAMTSEEAGKYVAEWAINFFDTHGAETIYSYKSAHRNAAYQGKKTSGITGSASSISFTDKYAFDCVAWLSMAVHQSIGLGGIGWAEFAVPYHKGQGSKSTSNPNPGFFNGYTTVYGKGGSNNKIPLNELKQQLKPGDLVMSIGPRKHVLLYVGDNTLIHCAGGGPGEEYGGNKGYGLVKESLDHYYQQWGIEAIGRLSESAASAINESNCTTIFGQAGAGITGVWKKASQGGIGVSSSSSSSATLVNKVTVNGMNEDLSLGLRYPKDNSNTSLNTFIDFTLPYLQTWMIPLAMNSGIMTKIEEEESDDYIKNPMFGYLTIKEAMSDILVERYDVTKCTLKTKYRVYDEITYSVSYDEEEGEWVTTETSRKKVDESSNGPMAERFVSKRLDVDTKYYIKKAYTFDVKINNECTYTKYNDSDVENRIEGGTGFASSNKENGESFSEGGDPGPDSDSNDSYTYIVKQGHYVNVTRIWEDKLEISDNTKIEPYNVDDVKDYIKNGGAKKQTTASYSQTGDIYNCKGYNLTEDQITRVAEIVYGEFGYDIEGAKNVASQMANLYEYGLTDGNDYGGVKKNQSFYDWVSTTTWYGGRTSHTTNDDMKKAVRQCIVEGKRTLPPYVHELVTFASNWVTPYYSDASQYIKGETFILDLTSNNTGVVYQIDPAPNGEGGNLFYYKEWYKEKCEANQNFTVTGNGSKSTTTSSIKSLDNFLFLGDDLMYGVKESGKISNTEFVNIVGSTPETWKKWLNGEQDKFDDNVDFSGKKLPAEDKIKGVCMMVGVNALNSDTSTEQVISDMKEVIDKLCEKYSSVPVYISKVLHVREGDNCTDPDEINEKIKTFNKEISSYCTSKGALCIDLSNNYVGMDNKLKEDKSKDGIHVNNYDDLAKNIQNAIVGSDVTNNPADTSGLEDFSGADIDYYRNLKVDNEINRVDMMNARPENYLKYIKKGTQYSNHVGYPRGYQVFSYDELKRLFKEYFEGNKLPYSYGASLGYATYKADSYVLDAGNISGSLGASNGTIMSSDSVIAGLGDLTGTGIEVGTALASQSYINAMKYFDIAKKYADLCGLDPYLIIAMIAQESSGNPNANGTAIGLMQWEKTNGQSVTLTKADGSQEKLNFTFENLRSDPDLQIKVGCAQLKNKIDSFYGNVLVALQGYNYGSGGIKRCVCHYISGGSGSGKYFGISDENYKEYIKSNDTGWISSTSWYTSTGHQAFSGAGGGDSKYLSNVLRYYNQEEAKKLNT